MTLSPVAAPHGAKVILDGQAGASILRAMPTPDLTAARALAARASAHPTAALARALAPVVVALADEIERRQRAPGRHTLEPETEDGRLIAAACERLGLKRAELAQRLGLADGSALSRASRVGGVALPAATRAALEGMVALPAATGPAARGKKRQKTGTQK